MFLEVSNKDVRCRTTRSPQLNGSTAIGKELHHAMDNPRTIPPQLDRLRMHYWANANASELAAGLRAALDRMNVKKATP